MSDTSSSHDQGYTSIKQSVSDVSSQSGGEFSLQNTKKVLNFDSGESWHEKGKSTSQCSGKHYHIGGGPAAYLGNILKF